MIPLKDHYKNTIVQELKDQFRACISYGCSEGYKSNPQYGSR